MSYAVVDSRDEIVGQAWHGHPADEHIIVLEGWVDIRYRESGRTAAIRAHAGQRLTVPATLPHRLTAQGLFESFLLAGCEWPAVLSEGGG